MFTIGVSLCLCFEQITNFHFVNLFFLKSSEITQQCLKSTSSMKKSLKKKTNLQSEKKICFVNKTNFQRTKLNKKSPKICWNNTFINSVFITEQ